MPCDAPLSDVYECEDCHCQFEAGAGGITRDGQPRCPQCGFANAHLLAAAQIGELVIMRWTSFG